LAALLAATTFYLSLSSPLRGNIIEMVYSSITGVLVEGEGKGEGGIF